MTTMTQKSFPLTAEFVAAANTTAEQYTKEYQQSIASPEANDAFWAKRAELIDWIKKPTKISNKINSRFWGKEIAGYWL